MTHMAESAPSDGYAGTSPARVMELAEDASQLQTFIDMLPDAEREVILLRHYAQMSFAQIAEAMETPLGTALARAHRGLAKLRGWMEPTT
jgi:RNA polymerase sigma-70 factor (ECF subfamily)